MKTEEREERAYLKLRKIVDNMELLYGENTNTELIYEGRINFKYEVMFCNEKNKVTVKKITVKL